MSLICFKKTFFCKQRDTIWVQNCETDLGELGTVLCCHLWAFYVIKNHDLDEAKRSAAWVFWPLPATSARSTYLGWTIQPAINLPYDYLKNIIGFLSQYPALFILLRTRTQACTHSDRQRQKNMNIIQTH
jgi:hypothetical protein